MSRSEHLEWCKKRAIEYIDRGEFANALASMASDLQKHPETRNHIAIGMSLAVEETESAVRKFIDGFN